MNSSTALPTDAIQEIVDRILSSRQITRIDQHLLLSLSSLNTADRNLINLIFDRLRSGLLKVVD
ncbi:hypothetical protein ACN4EK_08415 [Pantanalinema rosaneae CENA516]|uniref:hypothetical protein n=1 Tax=Pantanalinema rosaneae TaxID=1620701 RepID=UPI003D6E4A8F